MEDKDLEVTPEKLSTLSTTELKATLVSQGTQPIE